ncbi:site-specific integrase [Amycolatopsis sp. NPDC051045]|uniref:tyrosine-type recombinase/integrase n=1 Tax=Amycolatopsis sp. NPDC051045 TaxID=3156922 RepID=UPI00342B2CF6
MAARDQVAAATKGIGLTTGDWLAYWIRTVRLRSSTRRNYRQHVVTYLTPQLGDLPLVTLHVSDVRKAFTAIAAGSGSRYGRLAPSTVARVRATLSSALRAAVEEGLLAHNPARGPEIDLPEVLAPRPYVWTEERVARWRTTGWRPGPVCVWTRGQTIELLKSIAGHKRYLYYHLVAITGLRRGEAAALREVDVDLWHRELFVITRPDPGGQVDGDGKLKSRYSARTIALDHVTVGLVRRYLTARAGVPAGPGGERYLFTTPTGMPCRRDLFTHEFEDLLAERTQLPPIRLHDLRHGAASLSLAAGNDLKSIQDMLGHASMSFTADYYVSLYPSTRHQAAEKIGASLFATPSGRVHRTRLPLHCRRVAGNATRCPHVPTATSKI